MNDLEWAKAERQAQTIAQIRDIVRQDIHNTAKRVGLSHMDSVTKVMRRNHRPRDRATPSPQGPTR